MSFDGLFHNWGDFCELDKGNVSMVWEYVGFYGTFWNLEADYRMMKRRPELLQSYEREHIGWVGEGAS